MVKSFFLYIIWIFNIVILICLFILLFFIISPLSKFFPTLNKSEVFSELYFENHINLPKKVRPGEKYTFQFSIVNHENTTSTYEYRIYDATNEKTFGTGTVELQDNEKKTINALLFNDYIIKRSEIVVELIGRDQIHFWVEPI